LYAQGQHEQALRAAQECLALDEGSPELCNLAGVCAAAIGNFAVAEDYYRRAIALSGGHAQVYSNYANLLAKRGCAEEAERLYRLAIAQDPVAPVTHSNLGVLLADCGREDEAEQCFRQALALNPDYPLARMNLAQLLLSQGRLAEGWLHHEARYDPRLPSPDAGMPRLPFPQWNGEPLAGKSVLICPEQGMGDAIQFCRYVPMLKERGAARITLACRPALKLLLETLEGVDSVIGADAPLDAIEPHDYWAFPLSLPLHFKTRLDDIPSRIPYLRALPERMNCWASRIPAHGLRVGVVWKGNSGYENDAQRSLPHLSALAPLWPLDGVNFVSLQKGSGEEEARDYAEHIVHLGSEIEDFADVAAIVQQLDLVICIDTAFAHVAGALGKPCWVMLPAYKTDWRWLRLRTDTPWYPGSMRLFRQAVQGDWKQVVGDIKSALTQWRQRPHP
jgi:hypothetical protein